MCGFLFHPHPPPGDEIREREGEQKRRREEAGVGAGGMTEGVRFLVTGFGKFPGVPANPTEVLVNGLRGNRASSPNQEDQEATNSGQNQHGPNLVSCEVLKVSARTVEDHLGELEVLVSSRGGGEAKAASSSYVVVHFGVDVCARTFKLEKRAVNEANFRLPDEDGFQPRCAPVCPDAGDDLTSCLHTKLDVDRISAQLREDGFDCQVSMDAGRYVCNYTYFASLKRFEKTSGLYSLFVHVPSFNAIDAETQAAFVQRLFHRLAEDASAKAAEGASA